MYIKTALPLTQSFIVLATALGLAGCASSSSSSGEERIDAMELLLTKQKVISVSTSNNSNEFHVRLNGEDHDRFLVTNSDSERDKLIGNLERKGVPIRYAASNKPSPLVLYGVPVFVVLTIGGLVFYFRRRLQKKVISSSDSNQ
jgi:ATP-dependent Zn protease